MTEEDICLIDDDMPTAALIHPDSFEKWSCAEQMSILNTPRGFNGRKRISETAVQKWSLLALLHHLKNLGAVLYPGNVIELHITVGISQYQRI